MPSENQAINVLRNAPVVTCPGSSIAMTLHHLEPAGDLGLSPFAAIASARYIASLCLHGSSSPRPDDDNAHAPTPSQYRPRAP
jgi:hypothetical protein